MNWNWLRWLSIPLAALVVVGLAVFFFFGQLFAPICDTAPSTDIVSPDGRHVARLFNTFCNLGFGNSSDAHVVAVRKSSQSVKSETDVFVTFDRPPSVEWQDNTRLLIVVNGIHPINKSLRKAKDIEIVYRLRTDLTENRIRAEMRARQRELDASFGDKKYSESIGRQYESFISWAKENAE